MAFIARYDGTCVACGNPIKADVHKIERSFAHSGPQKYKHVRCDNVARQDYWLPGGEFSLPQLNVEIDLSNYQSVADVPLSAHEMDDLLSTIRERLENLKDIQKNFLDDIHFFEDQKAGFGHLIKKSRQEEEEEILRIRQMYLERRSGFTEQYEASVAEVEALNRLMRDAERQYQDELAAQGNIYELWTQRKALLELQGEFSAIMAKMPWADSMKGYQERDILHSIKVWRDEDTRNEGVLNANPMGLGKTYEAGAFIDIFREMFTTENAGRRPRILWLTRKSLMLGTMRELMRWNEDRKAVPVQGKPEMRELFVQMAIQNDMIVMANYEALNTTPVLTTIDWDLVLIDEVHHLKGGSLSSKTQIWLNTRDVLRIVEDPENSYPGHKRWKKADNAPFCYMISGSPLQNKPEEMWAYLHLFNPQQFPAVKEFKNLFAPYNVLEEQLLLDAMQGRFIRNDPDELGIERPEKHHSWRYVTLSPRQRELYDQVKEYILDVELQGEDKQVNLTHIFSMITRAWQVALWPPSIEFKWTDDDGNVIEVYGPAVQESAKLDEAMEIIEELTEEGEQVVVWTARFNHPLYELARRLQERGITYALMTSDAKDKLAEFEDMFQRGLIQVLLCQRLSVGEGFNFQRTADWPGGASHAILLDHWWNPKGNEQMEDRIWRMNSLRDVTIHHIVAEDTVDQFIMGILEEKEKFIEPVMGSERLRPLSEWRDLLRDMM